MTRAEAKKLIISTVEEAKGCKTSDLLEAAKVFEARAGSFDLKELISELVVENRLSVISYEMPSEPGIRRSFLLPEGSRIEALEVKIPAYGVS